MTASVRRAIISFIPLDRRDSSAPCVPPRSGTGSIHGHPWAPGPSLSESARPRRRRRDELPAGRVELDGYVSEKVDGDDKAERSTYPPREEPHAPHARAIDPARAPAATTTGEPVAAPLAIPRGRSSDPFVTGQARHVVATCNDRLPLWWCLGHGCS